MNTDQNAKNTTLTAILAEISQVLSHIPEDDLEITAKRLEQAPRIFVIGEGRSGLMARAFAMRLMHLGAVSYVIGETITPAIAEGDVLVAISGSGRTATRPPLGSAWAATRKAPTAQTSGRWSAGPGSKPRTRQRGPLGKRTAQRAGNKQSSWPASSTGLKPADSTSSPTSSLPDGVS